MPPPINKNPNKKKTGTVPKVISSTTVSASANVVTGGSSSSNRKNDSNTKTSSSSSSHKNTEIVAPTRRDLNDLNDYFLSVAESSSPTVKQHNSGVGGGNIVTNSTHLDTTCFDLENLNFHENQRYCYPVRPIPRQHNKEISDHNQSNRLTTASVSSSTVSNYHSTNNNSTTSNLNSAAAIGVVIPTTPNSAVLDDHNYNSSNSNRTQFHNSSINQSHHSSVAANSTDLNSNQQNFNIFDGDLSWEQRLSFIQYFLSLTSKPNNKEKDLSKAYAKMVNERKNYNGVRSSEVIVNSASLEDVIPNEASDTRAHSVTSIHTASDPNTPTYEELQSKLEASNRNIQNIKDQQQQLLRLQQAAKQHLVDMENIRNQTRNRSTPNRRRDDGTPDYESVEQVHDDMANLVNRMKSLQTLIQGQHELSALLGEDGPDILAEQEALQRKLEELKTQKQDMKNLVTELQEISNSAEKSAQAQQQSQQQQGDIRIVPVEYQRVVPIELVGAAKGNALGQQNKSIQNGHYPNHNGVHNGSLNSNSDTSDELNSENNLDDENPEVVAETTELIRQKMADINAMKNQLKRLKDMMEAVKMIEEKTEGRSVKDIGNDAGTDEPVDSAFTNKENQEKLSNKNNGSAEIPLGSDNKDGHTAEEEEMSEKVRILHEMTQDLREQARQMSSERDRLRVIKDEIKRRKEMAEKNTIRENSVQKSMSNTTSNLNNEAEKQLLEAEYEAKKKEFEKLCQRLQDEEEVVEDGRSDVQENDDEQQERGTIKEELPSHQYNRENWRCSNAASIPSIHSCKGGQSSEAGMTPLRGKDSADSGAADVHGQPSIEAASFKSGSSRSYSVPPPMRSINNREIPWRKNSQDNTSSQFNQFMAPPPPLAQQSGSIPPNWNPAYYYSTPYAQQQCSPHFHSGGGGGGDCCSHQCHLNSTLNVGGQQQAANSVSNDPVLLQQFIQTQQMLINSVSQCNQLLWHQQKEINNLNNAVLLLQERLSNSLDINSTRAESASNHLATNTFCIQQSTSRAQSEQPQSYVPQQQSLQQPPMSPIRTFHTQNHNMFQHYRRNVTNSTQCTHNHCCGNSSNNTSYNNFVAEQQQETSTGLCSQVPSAQSSNQNFLNNDIPPNSSGPGPIFMHHHNNTITPIQHHNHHNISNLRNSQQNCLNSPNINAVAPSSASAPISGSNNINSVPNTSSNAAAAAAALNNQVPPGNRANNYWDNFRSYSRQNLLSSSSCKSNEEQNHYYQQMNPSSLVGQNLSSSSTNQNLNGFRNLYQQHQQQQQQGANNSVGSNNVDSSTNGNGTGSNGVIANLDASKHVHTLRNHFNNINGTEQQQQQQQQHYGNSLHEIQQQQQNVLSSVASTEAPSNMENFQQQQQQQTNTTTMNVASSSSQNSNFMDNLNLNDELFNYNNNSNNSNGMSVAAIFGSPDFRNMNFNFGINDFQKKIPFKTPCSSSTKRIRNSTQSSPSNEMHLNRRLTNNIGNSESAQQLQQHNESIENMATSIHQQQANSTEDNRDSNQFVDADLEMNTVIESSVGAEGRTSEILDNQNDMPEEMKRNLLKNALKNDKFTTKFFESLRDNVCCELHSILHQTETNPQCLLQFLKELHNYNVYKRSCSDGSGGGGTESNDDDNNNELYENERNHHHHQQQHHLQQLQTSSGRQQYHQQQHITQTPLPLRNNNNTNNHKQLQQQISKESSNSISDEYSRLENNRDNEIMNSLINSQDLRQLAYKIMFESTSTSTDAVPSSIRSEKDRKVGLKYDKVLSSSQRSSPKIPNEVYRPDYELVNFLMSNVRNNIRQSHIDDDTIIHIAQLITLTLGPLQQSLSSSSSTLPSSCSLQIDRNLISPKEFYRRMKSFEVRNRDTFLSRLETYLQTLFVMKISNDDSRNNTNSINKKTFDNNISNATTRERGIDGVETDVNLSSNHNTGNIRKIHQNSSKSNIPHGIEEATSTNDNREEIKNSVADSTINGNNSNNSDAEGLQFFSLTNRNQNEENTTAGLNAAMFFRNSPIYHQQHHHLSADTSLNGPVYAAEMPTITTTNNTKSQSQIISPNAINNSNNIMNEDLAEADQICSSNNVICTDNSLPPILSSKRSHQLRQHQNSYKQQSHQYFEAAENCFGNQYPQSATSTSDHQIGIINSEDNDIQNLASNYSNFTNGSQSHFTVSSLMTSHYQKQPQHQLYNQHRENLIAGNEYESQFFKKYWNEVQNESEIIVEAEINRENADTDDSDKIENDSTDKKVKANFVGNDDNYMQNVNSGDGCSGGGNDDAEEDDGDDEEEDDRAQFMMTDAACALVFPIVSNANTGCDSIELMPSVSSHSHQNSINSMPVSTIATSFNGGNNSGGEISTTKRNSVP